MACIGPLQIRCVQESTVLVMERFGEFSRVVPAGLLCYVWPLETSVAKLSLRVLQLVVYVETKTKDNVFVRVGVSVQFKIIPEKAEQAYYKLTDREAQIRSFVEDVIRSSLPRLDLDTAFLSKDELARSVKEELREKMDEYGYEIVETLVTDLDPDQAVRASMNEINTNRRLRIAANYRADAEKITLVKAAEADAKSKELSGEGVARQRKAIMNGLRESVAQFTDQVDTTPSDVVAVLLLTQYFDTLGNVGSHKNATSYFMPETIEGDVQASTRDGILHAHAGMMR